MKINNPTMHFKLNLTIYLAMLMIFSAMFFTGADMSCESCGRECASACGTKHFRTCCFNYLRKRSDPPESDRIATNLVETPAEGIMSLERKLQRLIKDSKDLQETVRLAMQTKGINTVKRHPTSSDEFIEIS